QALVRGALVEVGPAVQVVVGKRAQQRGVDDAEDGGGGADGQGQHQGGAHGDGGRPAQGAQGVGEGTGEGGHGGILVATQPGANVRGRLRQCSSAGAPSS